MTKTNKYLLIGAIVLILTMSSSSVYGSLATFLKKYEEDNKAALTAYDDGYGTWTIGWDQYLIMIKTGQYSQATQ